MIARRRDVLLLDKLKSNAGILPMHMPGHKRNAALLGRELPYGLDITEIHGFDDLHDMHGILRELSDKAARMYGAARAFPLVNGTTGGILAAVRSCAGDGGSIVMSRFSHKSVYNAAALCRLKPVYLLPEQKNGMPLEILPEAVNTALKSTPDVRCVVITSPTYEGIISDIAAISGVTQSFGVPLIVDAAHGAHFGFSSYFPQNAVRQGADIELVSLHKTLPALTQSSLALMGGVIADADELERQLRVFETSSPSYVLLASIDECLELLREKGDKLFSEFAENLSVFYKKTAALRYLETPGENNTSCCSSDKIVIATEKSNITGKTLLKRLRDEHEIELEMAAPDYALAMTTICDTPETLGRLADALLEIDETLRSDNGVKKTLQKPLIELPRMRFAPHEAAGHKRVRVPLSAARGRVSLEYVWAYPPAVPLLAAGEIIGSNAIEAIKQLEASGIEPRSDYGILPDIMCVK